MKIYFRTALIIIFLFASTSTIFFLLKKNQTSAGISAPETDSSSVEHREIDFSKSNAEISNKLKAPPNGEDSSQLGDTLNLDQAKKLLENYKSKITSVTNQAEFATELVVKLCKSGHTNEAWEFITPSPGQMRDMQLREFFKNADLNREELIAKLSGFEFQQDLLRGLQGYLLRFKPSEYLRELSSPELKVFENSLGFSPSEAIKRAMCYAMDDMFGAADSNQNPPSDDSVKNLVDSFKDMKSKGLIATGDFLNTVIESPARIFVKWDLLKDQVATSDGVSDNLRERLIRNMIISNPSKAVDQILAVQGAGMTNNVNIAIAEWVSGDSNGATSWYVKNRTSFDQQQQNLIISAFSNTALSSSEFDSARQWAGQIQDLRLKEDKLKAIDEKEVDSLRTAPVKQS